MAAIMSSSRFCRMKDREVAKRQEDQMVKEIQEVGQLSRMMMRESLCSRDLDRRRGRR